MKLGSKPSVTRQSILSVESQFTGVFGDLSHYFRVGDLFCPVIRRYRARRALEPI
jgi:hypothetical protein